MEAMAADPGIDAIYIGTPNHTHKDLAIKCMKHGKHVLCEKPMAASAKDVREMADVARENGVILMEAMISTLSPNFRNVRKELSGLGAPRQYSAAFCQYSSKYDLLKRIIAGEEDVPVPSSFNPDCAGGALADVGIYTIYPMVALFGKPLKVKAFLTTCKVPLPSERGGKVWKDIDLAGNALFEYPDGLLATVEYSKISDSKSPTEISCDGGTILMDQIHITRHVERTFRGAPTSGRSSGPAAEDITVTPDADEYLCEFTEFIDLVQGVKKESESNSLEISLAVADIMDEIRRQAGI